MPAGYPRALSAIGRLTSAAGELARAMGDHQPIDAEEVLQDLCRAARSVIAIHRRERDQALDAALSDWLGGRDG